MARDVLKHYNGLVDQQTDGQRQSTQRDRVQALAAKIESDASSHDRERQRKQDDKHGSHAAQKNEHHDGGESRTEDAFLDQIANRFAHVNGLIHHHIQLDAFWQPLQDTTQFALDSVYDLDRVSARLSINRNVHLTAAIHSDDVSLNLARVFRVRDILDENRCAAVGLDGKVIDLVHVRNHAVGNDLVVKVPELRIARRNHQIVRPDRIDYIHWRETARLKLLAIDVSENASQFSTVDRGGDDAGDALQAIAQIKVGHIVKLLLVKLGAANGNQSQRG